jgi:hypothetical protein
MAFRRVVRAFIIVQNSKKHHIKTKSRHGASLAANYSLIFEPPFFLIISSWIDFGTFS